MADFDAIVTGGGIVGAAVALTVAAAGRRVLLIDSRVPEITTGGLGFDARTVALSPASVRFLEDLGLGAIRRQPIAEMRVWEREGTAAIDFEAASVGAEALAEVFETSHLVVDLWRLAHDAVTVRAPEEISGIEIAPDRVTVSLGGLDETNLPARTSSDTLTAELLIIAEGSRSQSRDRIGARVKSMGPVQGAIATAARTERAHEGTAYQRFGNGVLAFLPLMDAHVVSVIWSMPESRIAETVAMDDESFAAALEAEAEHVLGRVVEVDRRFSFPLTQAIVDDFNPAPRALIVGDAARSVHPLAGQGVNLGFEDVRGIDKVIRRGPQDLGAAGLWRRFAARRRLRARMMIALMAGFDRAYGDGDPYFRWLRNVGVRGVDGTPFIKNQIIREAMGFGPMAARAI